MSVLLDRVNKALAQVNARNKRYVFEMVRSAEQEQQLIAQYADDTQTVLTILRLYDA